MLVDAIATAVLLAELGVMIRYRFVRARKNRPGDWPRPTDFRNGHLAAALAAAAAGWALVGAPTGWGDIATILFLGVFVPGVAALAATTLWRPYAGWAVCVAGGLAAGTAVL
ncbi:hypothetical protein ACF073_23270 [Streptomyces sp. NPDC015171]|uniref:hypothetical protein n=1 Tax=Streptomyces sp. NPDC015171 TaxID=3364945 RepID=UPI0036FA9ACB